MAGDEEVEGANFDRWDELADTQGELNDANAKIKELKDRISDLEEENGRLHTVIDDIVGTCRDALR
jgi:predicted nuclease with TOPRIM domain